jgi:hypothetical protein
MRGESRTGGREESRSKTDRTAPFPLPKTTSSSRPLYVVAQGRFTWLPPLVVAPDGAEPWRGALLGPGGDATGV